MVTIAPMIRDSVVQGVDVVFLGADHRVEYSVEAHRRLPQGGAGDHQFQEDEGIQWAEEEVSLVEDHQ